METKQRVSDTELCNMTKKEFCWPIPDLAADLVDTRIELLGARLELFDARQRIKELERLSASQEEAIQMMERGSL